MESLLKKDEIENNRAPCNDGDLSCKAECCRLNVPLTDQDMGDGVVEFFEYEEGLFFIKQKNGYCTHFDRENFRCIIWEHRPTLCRLYSCSDN